MVSGDLVLSLFPGIGLLDHAFDLEGFCVVRGPDPIWGGDIRRFTPPAGRFDLVIGGPPCQIFSALAPIVRANGNEIRFGNLIPEYERVVFEAQPAFFVMENVEAAPEPSVSGYEVRSLILNNRWLGGEQSRVRRFSFGSRDGVRLDVSPDLALFEPLGYSRTVTSSSGGRGPGQPSSTGKGRGEKGQGHRFRLDDACRLQGMPPDFLQDAPFTSEGKLKAIANGVPIPMGRAIARAVRRAIGLPVFESEVAS